MTQVFELIMLICFGLSWPISVYKSLTSRSIQGKSLAFMIAIIIGYICGILGKIIGGELNYVITLYLLNLFFVSMDLVLYFINRKHNKIHHK